MRSPHFLTGIIALGAITTTAQFVVPPAESDWTHVTGFAGIPVRYKEVPSGICETKPGVKSYSGYAEVRPGHHLFFWLHEARTNASQAPLTVWTNGNVAGSSLDGMFQEIGPCRIDSEGNVVNNPLAWNEVSNLLFLDHNVGAGLAFSGPTPAHISYYANTVRLPDNKCPEFAYQFTCGTYSLPSIATMLNSTAAGADGFYHAIQGFLGAFPQYARPTIAYASESTGSAALYSDYLRQQNAKAAPGTKSVTVDTLIMGNAWFDPPTQFEAYYKYTQDSPYSLPPYDARANARVRNALYGPGNCMDKQKDCVRSGVDGVCSLADSFCIAEVQNAFDVETARDETDVRYLAPSPFPSTFHVDYLNSEKVQRAIGAYTNFTGYSRLNDAALRSTGDDSREQGMIDAAKALLADSGVYQVLLYADADYGTNWLGGAAVADKIGSNVGYAEAGFTRIQYSSDSDAPLAGEVRQSNNFAFVRLYQAGHSAVFFQPRATLEILRRALQRKDIATGTVPVADTYRTDGPKVSTYREGTRTVQTQVVPSGSSYNTTTGQPNPISGGGSALASSALDSVFRDASARNSRDPMRASQVRTSRLTRQQRARLRFTGKRIHLPNGQRV